jgi:hypothetical protein
MDRKSIVGKAVDNTKAEEDSLGFKVFFYVTLGLAPLCLLGAWVEAGFLFGVLIAAAVSAAAFGLGCLINGIIEAYWQVRLGLRQRRKSS